MISNVWTAKLVMKLITGTQKNTKINDRFCISTILLPTLCRINMNSVTRLFWSTSSPLNSMPTSNDILLCEKFQFFLVN